MSSKALQYNDIDIVLEVFAIPYKVCATLTAREVHLIRLDYNFGLAASTCTGSTLRASTQLTTSSMNTSLCGLGSSCTVVVSSGLKHTNFSNIQR